jgi:hypothetical protein
VTIWSEDWRSADDRVRSAESAILALGTAPVRGGDYDAWDLEIRAGLLGFARLRHTVEEHGAGRQLVRFRLTPRPTVFGLLLPVLLALPMVGAIAGGARVAALTLACLGAAALLLAVRELSIAMALALHGARLGDDGDSMHVLLERVSIASDAAPRLPGSLA